MESVRSLLMTPGHVESHETKFERIGRVLSRGFMIGAAILQPVFAQYEHTFYKLLHLTPDSRFIPPDGGSEVDEHSIHMLGIVDEYFAHMDGGQGEQYHTPSQVSSDISLSNAGPGRLPPSCDTMTRTFWPDNIDQNRECRKDDGDENQES
ncbi:hypothetical protein F4781DRAFT_435808 [Annulohypoxylon bovei var. microspora]|nr:hypothetical protein F4781DRAFT_435808 [Annulohypoxylon bovei var. microspora]